MIKKDEKKTYLPPQLTVVAFATERGFAASSTDGILGSGFHDPFFDFGDDPWSGSASSGSTFGRWTDNDNNAWD